MYTYYVVHSYMIGTVSQNICVYVSRSGSLGDLHIRGRKRGLALSL